MVGGWREQTPWVWEVERGSATRKTTTTCYMGLGLQHSPVPSTSASEGFLPSVAPAPAPGSLHAWPRRAASFSPQSCLHGDRHEASWAFEEYSQQYKLAPDELPCTWGVKQLGSPHALETAGAWPVQLQAALQEDTAQLSGWNLDLGMHSCEVGMRSLRCIEG